MNNYEFKDGRNPMTAAAAVTGNKDNGKNDSNNNNDRQTSSAQSKFYSKNSFSHTTASSVP
jgi:hypothetical protein